MARRTVPPLIFAAIFGQVSVWTFVPTKICGGSIHVREDALMPDDLMELKTRIYQAAELLPIQGPISAFVFLNPLMGLEHLPFAEGVKKVPSSSVVSLICRNGLIAKKWPRVGFAREMSMRLWRKN